MSADDVRERKLQTANQGTFHGADSTGSALGGQASHWSIRGPRGPEMRRTRGGTSSRSAYARGGVGLLVCQKPACCQHFSRHMSCREKHRPGEPFKEIRQSQPSRSRVSATNGTSQSPRRVAQGSSQEMASVALLPTYYSTYFPFIHPQKSSCSLLSSPETAYPLSTVSPAAGRRRLRVSWRSIAA
jgi:hypothetical protein